MERLSKSIKPKGDYREFSAACIGLARLIDSAVAKNQKLSVLPDLTHVLRKVCEQKDNEMFQSGIMVLLLSVKTAMYSGWFSAAERQELNNMSKEILYIFTGLGEWNAIDAAEATEFISTILPRFYPSLSIQTIIIALEAKSGYGAMVRDFHVLKKLSASEELRLFVIRKDNQDTSACLITPNHVNFLVNGKGVENRSLASMDTGPQMPTNVTGMVKIGTNLMQIVGDFSGPYMIAIAQTCTAAGFSSPLRLPIYSIPGVKAQADDELIEGPSRVSLRCPISHKRIMSPVKGYSCKHHQCFDYYTFMAINSRRPAWRCPYCNRHVSFPDLRLDLQMLKILKETHENAFDVMVSEDGSWETITDEETITGNTAVSQSYRRKDTNSQINSGDTSSAEEGEIRSEKFSSRIIDLSDDDEQERHSNREQNDECNSSGAAMRFVSVEMEDRKPELRDINVIASESFTNVQASAAPNVIGTSVTAVQMGLSEASREESFEAASTSDILGSTSAITLGNPDLNVFLAMQALPGEGDGCIAGTSADSLTERQSNRETSRAPIAIQALPAQISLSNVNFRSRIRTTSQPNSPAQASSSSNSSSTSAIQFNLSQTSPQIVLPSFAGVQDSQLLLNAGHQQVQQDTPSMQEISNTNQVQQGVEMREQRQRLIQHSRRPNVNQPPSQPDQRVFVDHPYGSGARSLNQLRSERQGLNQQQASLHPTLLDPLNLLENQIWQQVRFSAPSVQQAQQLQQGHMNVNNTFREENVNPAFAGIAEGIPLYNQSSDGSMAMVGALRRQSSQGARAVSSQLLHSSNNPLIVPNTGNTPREQRWVSSADAVPAQASDMAPMLLTEQNQRRMRGCITSTGRPTVVNVSHGQSQGSPMNYTWLYGISSQSSYVPIPPSLSNPNQPSRFSPVVSTSWNNDLSRQWNQSRVSTGSGVNLQTSQTSPTLGSDFNWLDMSFENPMFPQGPGNLFDPGDLGSL